MKTNRDFLACEVAKQLLIRSEEMVDERHKRWLREEADSLAEGHRQIRILFILQTLHLRNLKDTERFESSVSKELLPRGGNLALSSIPNLLMHIRLFFKQS